MKEEDGWNGWERTKEEEDGRDGRGEDERGGEWTGRERRRTGMHGRE